MSRFLQILSMLLKIAASYIDLFEAGWRIEVFSIRHFDGVRELRRVKHWWSRALRGIRYCRGTEGRPEPKCECGYALDQHEVCCPEVSDEVEIVPDVGEKPSEPDAQHGEDIPSIPFGKERTEPEA